MERLESKEKIEKKLDREELQTRLIFLLFIAVLWIRIRIRSISNLLASCIRILKSELRIRVWIQFRIQIRILIASKFKDINILSSVIMWTPGSGSEFVIQNYGSADQELTEIFTDLIHVVMVFDHFCSLLLDLNPFEFLAFRILP